MTWLRSLGSPAEIYDGVAGPRRALVDQLAIFYDGMAMSFVVFEKSIRMDIIPVEELNFSVAVAFERWLAIERCLLIRIRANSVTATGTVLSVCRTTHEILFTLDVPTRAFTTVALGSAGHRPSRGRVFAGISAHFSHLMV